MKRLSRIFILIFLSFSTFGCMNEEISVQKDQLVIELASSQAKILFGNQIRELKNLNENRAVNSEGLGGLAYDLDEFDLNELRRISDTESGKTLYTALKSNNSSQTLSFGMNDTGELINAFVSTTEVSENDVISNSIFSLDGQLELAFEVMPDGTRSVTYVKDSIRGGQPNQVEGWWSRFDHCVGELNGPTPSNVANVFFGIIANAATMGLYTPLSLVVCAGVASLSDD